MLRLNHREMFAHIVESVAHPQSSNQPVHGETCALLDPLVHSCLRRSHRAPMQMEDDDEYEQLPVVPLGDKKLRACLVTGLVKTEDQVCATVQTALIILRNLSTRLVCVCCSGIGMAMTTSTA